MTTLHREKARNDPIFVKGDSPAFLPLPLRRERVGVRVFCADGILAPEDPHPTLSRNTGRGK
jgi:hypothetical protein